MSFNNTFKYITPTNFNYAQITKDISRQIIQGRINDQNLVKSITFNIKMYKGKCRFLITDEYTEDLENYYYETEALNFKKLISVKL